MNYTLGCVRQSVKIIYPIEWAGHWVVMEYSIKTGCLHFLNLPEAQGKHLATCSFKRRGYVWWCGWKHFPDVVVMELEQAESVRETSGYAP